MSGTRATVAVVTLVAALAGCSSDNGSGTRPDAQRPAGTPAPSDTAATDTAATDNATVPYGGAPATVPAPRSPQPEPGTAKTPVPPAGRPTPLSQTTAPVAPRPPRPHKTPTDRIDSDGWVVGTVVDGGTGPCYRLQTDDGLEYAMHSATRPALTRGSRIRVRVTPTAPTSNCGPGRPVRLDAAEPLN